MLQNSLLSIACLSYSLRLFEHLRKFCKKRQRVNLTTMERVGTSIWFCLAQQKTQSFLSVFKTRRSRCRGGCDVKISKAGLSTSSCRDGFSKLDSMTGFTFVFELFSIYGSSFLGFFLPDVKLNKLLHTSEMFRDIFSKLETRYN